MGTRMADAICKKIIVVLMLITWEVLLHGILFPFITVTCATRRVVIIGRKITLLGNKGTTAQARTA
eukprot:7995785-Karenia_brevis.AAC.1